VSYSFLFMQANGAQLRELAALYDAGHLRPLIDKTFPFEQTLEALAYVERGRANGKVVITLAWKELARYAGPRPPRSRCSGT
jgi:NADPH:quinone reductase-like Zn-dependent oxidoreductase